MNTSNGERAPEDRNDPTERYRLGHHAAEPGGSLPAKTWSELKMLKEASDLADGPCRRTFAETYPWGRAGRPAMVAR